MDGIFGGGEIGAQQNQKPVERPAEKQVTWSEEKKTEKKEVQNGQTQTDAGKDSRNDAAKYKEKLKYFNTLIVWTSAT